MAAAGETLLSISACIPVYSNIGESGVSPLGLALYLNMRHQPNCCTHKAIRHPQRCVDQVGDACGQVDAAAVLGVHHRQGTAERGTIVQDGDNVAGVTPVSESPAQHGPQWSPAS